MIFLQWTPFIKCGERQRQIVATTHPIELGTFVTCGSVTLVIHHWEKLGYKQRAFQPGQQRWTVRTATAATKAIRTVTKIKCTWGFPESQSQSMGGQNCELKPHTNLMKNENVWQNHRKPTMKPLARHEFACLIMLHSVMIDQPTKVLLSFRASQQVIFEDVVGQAWSGWIVVTVTSLFEVLPFSGSKHDDVLLQPTVWTFEPQFWVLVATLGSPGIHLCDVRKGVTYQVSPRRQVHIEQGIYAGRIVEQVRVAKHLPHCWRHSIFRLLIFRLLGTQSPLLEVSETFTCKAHFDLPSGSCRLCFCPSALGQSVAHKLSEFVQQMKFKKRTCRPIKNKLQLDFPWEYAAPAPPSTFPEDKEQQPTQKTCFFVFSVRPPESWILNTWTTLPLQILNLSQFLSRPQLCKSSGVRAGPICKMIIFTKSCSAIFKNC